ncbi:MAG: adenylate/guanylate cyclase domain-containing protein [Planctomycetales bacterium]
MLELIIEGPEPRQRLRYALQVGQTYLLGRDPQAEICVPWDDSVSRRQAKLTVTEDGLAVRRLAGAANPLFHSGRAVESVTLRPGEHFVVGGTCCLANLCQPAGAALPADQPIEEVTFSREALAQVRFRDPDRRIDVLSHLPEVIWGARNDGELYVRLVNLLLAGIAAADAVGIVAAASDGTARVLHADRRRETAGPLRPSARLVQEAVVRRGQSVLHVWESHEQPVEFTATQEFDWAFCTPVPGAPGELWGLYLGGKFDQPLPAAAVPRLFQDGGHLHADVKFAEIVAEIVGSVRKLKHLERRQAGLRQFLPPAILAAMGEEADADLLAPREAEVTVMFCDLRGFSRQAESSRDDLTGLLDRTSQTLGVMTKHISEFGGVIGDFQGDAAMGFWGWPVAAPDDPLKACRAALAIRRAFSRAACDPESPLADFRVGIGLARGPGVAGRIGTGEHFVFTAFGPVVNLASRLEGMTRHLRVPIIIDEGLAEIVRGELPLEEGRLRTLAKVLPYGMETPVLVSELLPGESEMPELTAAHLAAYDRAVTHFVAGEWEAAYASLRTLPSGDRAQDFLALQIAQNNRTPPADWSGVVKLPSK